MEDVQDSFWREEKDLGGGAHSLSQGSWKANESCTQPRLSGARDNMISLAFAEKVE